MTPQEIEDRCSRGTTDHNRVKCLYQDDMFALVKWPGGSFWNGMTGTGYCSPWVKMYPIDSVSYRTGKTVWECARDKDGPLTAKRLLALVNRLKGKSIRA